MELLNSLVGQINDILWSYVLIILLIGAGIIFTIRTKFVQIRFIKEMIRLLLAMQAIKWKDNKFLLSRLSV